MTPRRSDPLRASANHVIRKFSMASITSNFSSSKRSASYTSITQSRGKEDMPPPKSRASGRESNRSTHSSKPKRPPLVNFHNTPEAFLPTDFELQDPATKRKKSALRTLTMTMERPFSPLLGHDLKQSGLRRAQSVRDASEAKRPANIVPPIGSMEDKPPSPVYSLVQERPKTPAMMQTLQPSVETTPVTGVFTKTPKKSKSKLLRLFR